MGMELDPICAIGAASMFFGHLFRILIFFGGVGESNKGKRRGLGF